MTKNELEKDFLAQKAAKKLEKWASESSRPTRNKMLVTDFINKHNFPDIIAALWYVQTKKSMPYYGWYDRILEHSGKPYVEKVITDLKVS